MREKKRGKPSGTDSARCEKNIGIARKMSKFVENGEMIGQKRPDMRRPGEQKRSDMLFFGPKRKKIAVLCIKKISDLA